MLGCYAFTFTAMPATVDAHTLFRLLGFFARAFVGQLPKPSGTFNIAERFVKLQGPLQSEEASPAAPISRGDLKSVMGPSDMFNALKAQSN